MSKSNKRRVLLTLGLGVLMLVGLFAGQALAQALPVSPIYNLYATDGYVTLADGTQTYMYGFVGGRADKPAEFQLSSVMPPTWPKKVPFTPNAPFRLTGVGAPSATTGALYTQNLATGLWTAPAAAAIKWPDPSSAGNTLATTPEGFLIGNAQFPAPIIYATAGTPVEIRLKNLGVSNQTAPNDPHTIHLHGLDVDVANDGVPETSVAAVPSNLAVPGAGNVIVYMFNPERPGTYMYHCHQEADIHVQMGMYGALVVYNPTDAAAAGGPTTGGGNLFGFNYDKDVVMLLSEIDTRQHVSEQQGVGGNAAFNPVNYKPQYWFVNGLSFPNTIHASAGPAAPFNWNAWSITHPGYDPLITGSVGTKQKVLIRVINMGFETQPMHMHGFHGKILGSDQRAWSWANDPNGPSAAAGIGLEKNTLTVGSGETYEWLIDFGTLKSNVSTYANGTATATTPDVSGQPPYKGTYPGGTQTRFENVVGANLNKPLSNTVANKPAIPVLGFAIAPNTYIGGPVVAGLWGPDNWNFLVNGGALQPTALQPATGATSGNPQTPAVGANATIPSQIFVFHNHDDYKATNNGVYPGGMFTAIVPLP